MSWSDVYGCNDPYKESLQPSQREDGFWILGWALDYIVISVTSGTIIEFNSIRVKVEENCVVHFPQSAMRYTQIAVSPKPLSVEYRFSTTTEEMDRYRNKNFYVKLPDDSMSVVSNGLLNKK